MRFLFGDCILDPTRRELSRGGEAIHVEPQVFDLLLHLIRNREQVVSKDDLLAAVWGGRIVSESTLNNRVNTARRVIGDSGEHQRFIRTVARRGFRFVGDVRQEPIDANRNDESLVPAPASTQPVRPYGADGDRQTPPGGRCESGGKPTVAVLPFNNMSGDPEREYFSDGITEDIITALSKHRSLLVIARNSAFAFKGHCSDVRRIGTELRADYVVEGSVRKIGHGLRITAHLIETEGGRLVWAEQYDCDLEEIFALQDEITRTIAARIEPGVGTAERLRAERKPPEALQAWDLYRLGMKHFYRFSAEDNLEAQRLFRRAGALDSELAQAYAFLSYAIVLGMLYFDAEPDDGVLSEAEGLARKGVELDDQDALIRFIHGRVLLARGSYGDALAELETALELNPSLPAVYCGLGDTLAYEGRFDEAIPYFEKAIDLSPYDPQRWAFYSYGALAQLFALKFDKALDWAQMATRIPNCHYWPFAHRVAALGHMQRVEDLGTAVAELLQRRPGFSCDFARKRLFYVKEPAQLDVYVEGLRKAGIPTCFGMKVLVVDDHVLVRDALRGVLKGLRKDATVLEASNSREALQLVVDHADLALILLDLNLPDRDGFAVLAELRERCPGISIVVLSGFHDRINVVRALKLGALGFIPKSAEREVMISALNLVFSGGVYIPPEILTGDEPTWHGQPTSKRLFGDSPPTSPADVGLTERQIEVLALIMQGKSNKVVCRMLDLAEPTVKNHVTAILKALKVTSRTEAVIAVSALGWDFEATHQFVDQD